MESHDVGGSGQGGSWVPSRSRFEVCKILLAHPGLQFGVVGLKRSFTCREGVDGRLNVSWRRICRGFIFVITRQLW